MLTFTVATRWDVVDANDGKLSLREAAALANASAEADTLSFGTMLEGRRLMLTRACSGCLDSGREGSASSTATKQARRLGRRPREAGWTAG